MKAATLLLLAAPGTLAAQYNPLNYGAFTDFLIPKPVLVARSSSPLERRAYDASITGTIIDSFYTIGNDTVSLTQAIKDFSLATIFSLQTSSLGLVNTIQSAASTVGASSENITSDDDVVAITVTVSKIATLTNQSVEAAIAQKQTFGGVSPVVLASFQQLLNATTKLTTAITGKLPAKYISSAAAVSAPIFQALNNGVSAFKEPNVNPYSVYAATSMSGAATTLASRFAVGLGLTTFGIAYLFL